MNWLQRWERRPVAVLAVTLGLLVAGGWIAAQVPLEWAPSLHLAEVTITASWPGAPPRAVERHVTAPIERAVQRVRGTAKVESLSEEGLARVRLEIAPGTDLAFYAAEVGDRLSLLRSVLPPRVAPRLDREVPAVLRQQQGFMTLEVGGDAAPEALREVADSVLAPRLRSLAGVARVEVQGGRGHELLVTLLSDRLAAYALSPGEVRGRLLEELADRSFGRLASRGGSVLLLSSATEKVAALRDLTVATTAAGAAIRLAQVARLEVGPEPVSGLSRIDGRPVVSLVVERTSGSSLLAAAAAVRRQLYDVQAELPPGLRLRVADDRSERVRDQLRDLAWRGGLGLLLVVLLVVLVLRSAAAVGIVLLNAAVAAVLGVALLGILGLTLNLVTLAGLVLLFGFLVNNGLVVVERLLVERTRPRVHEAAGRALRAVWLPLFGGTLATLMILVPLVYLSGDLRALFLPLAVLVALVLGFSLASAVLLLPVLGRFLPRGRPRRKGWAARVAQAVYGPAARFPRTGIALLLLAIGLPLWLLPQRLEEVPAGGPRDRLARLYNATLGHAGFVAARRALEPALGGVLRPFVRETEFGTPLEFGSSDEILVRVSLPPGSGIEETDRLLAGFERVAVAAPGIERTIVQVGGQRGFLRALFAADDLAGGALSRCRDRLVAHASGLAGLEIHIQAPGDFFYSSGAGGVSGYLVDAFGSQYRELEELATSFARRLADHPRVTGVDVNADRFGFASAREIVRVSWGGDAAGRSGVSASGLAAALLPLLDHPLPIAFADLEGQPGMPVRVVAEGSERQDLRDLETAPIAAGPGRRLRLADLGAVSIERQPASIERLDQQYVRHLQVLFKGPAPLAQRFLGEEIARQATPPGYRLELGSSGLAAHRDDLAEAPWPWLLLGTAGLVLLSMAVVFESWRLPFLAILSVPSAFLGLAVGFLVSETAFSQGAFLGAVLLIGISVNDSILLVDAYRRLRAARPRIPPTTLILLAIRQRLRPMWVTTLTSIATLAPLLVALGDDDFWPGLAVAVIGGLLGSTLVAPLLITAAVSLARPARG